MPIKIACTNCGFQNDLGRVFCAQCSRKLDLNRTALEDLEERRTFEPGRLIGPILVTLIVGGALTVAGLALWPMPRPPVPFDPAGANQVPLKTAAVKTALRANRPVTLTFTETELNGYLAARAAIRKVDSLTIDLKRGKFDLQAACRWTAITNASSLAGRGLSYTYGMTAGFQGGQLNVTGGRVGHLPLPGPALALSKTYFAGLFDDLLSETGIVSAVKSVQLDDAKVEILLGR